MIPKEKLVEMVCNSVDENRDWIISVGEQIMRNPELGFKEFKTAKLVAEIMDELCISYQTELAITGVKGKLEGSASGPTLALLGELDSLVVSGHPMADEKTGAAHACGHNAQIAGLMGAAIAIAKTNLMNSLAGNLVFFAVPAEEYVEVEYRTNLVSEGKLEFLGGKPELIRRGHFDDIDLSMMIHTWNKSGGYVAGIADSSNGCVVKMIEFVGKAAHAGGAPHSGINALNAANIAISAIHAQRETFRDSDTIRVHPIITRGGDTVNVVPSLVSMETYVRGKTLEAIEDANEKVDRSLRAGAQALGAKVKIQTLPGYMPLINNKRMASLFMKNAEKLFGKENVGNVGHRTGSTDMGDVSQIMPAIHPYINGVEGQGHSVNWKIVDKDTAYLGKAKILAMTAIDLLYDNAQEAKKILESTKPKMTKEEYLEYQRSINKVEIYNA